MQSGDVSRALQLTAATISVVDAISLAKTTESQALGVTKKRIMVKISLVKLLSTSETLQVTPLKKPLSGGLIM